MRFGKSSNDIDYKIGSDTIKRAEEVKDLGVYIDSKLTFKNHCRKIVKKANFLSYVVLKHFKFCSPKINTLFFKHISNPYLIINNIIFYYSNTKFFISLIEKVQKRFTKKYALPVSPTLYSQRLDMLFGFTIEKNHKVLVLINMYSIVFRGLTIEVLEYNHSSSFTRGFHFKILLPFSRTNTHKLFALLRYVQLWNSLEPKPSDLVSFAAFSLKTLVKRRHKA